MVDKSKASIQYDSPVLIIGGGIAGISTAIELLDRGQQVLLIDRDEECNFGGMANEAFGGMLFVDTPLQRLNGIKDSKQLALDDWFGAAEFSTQKMQDPLAKAWANAYIERSREDVYDWLKNVGIQFFPIVHWVERGDYGFKQGSRGNSVPRYHVVWGTGYGLTQTLIQTLMNHKNKHKLSIKFQHKVDSFLFAGSKVIGCRGSIEGSLAQAFQINSHQVVICAGGINGNLAQVKKHWDVETYGEYPENILSGSHPYADGLLHDEVSNSGGSIKNRGWMWNYASGIKHPKPEYPNHGLSLMPARSSLWLDAKGERIGPMPLVTGFDTHNLCKVTGQLEGQYSWQVMNYKIACKELAVSGSHLNKAFLNKSWLGILKMALKGNEEMVRWLMSDCNDVVVADNVPSLVGKMNELEALDIPVKLSHVQSAVQGYDDQIQRGLKFTTDDQIRKIHFMRQWRGDKVRTLKSQKILDEKAGPLIAIRTRIISRKSMGGFETNTRSEVVDQSGLVMEGLYAAGEAAGFGGAGCSGIRSLEGTFLSLCILNGRVAGQTIAAKLNQKADVKASASETENNKREISA